METKQSRERTEEANEGSSDGGPNVKGALCVAIWKLSVPRWVPNGTEEPVLLDCEYVYNEHDVRLVVKWFFNDLLEPVYQWIPELNSRQASGILAGHLDDSSYTGPSQYRALRIIRPTTEMSGLYTCVVSSLAGIDSRQQSMMVYVGFLYGPGADYATRAASSSPPLSMPRPAWTNREKAGNKRSVPPFLGGDSVPAVDSRGMHRLQHDALPPTDITVF
ncbi:hypothetical protein MTO96_007347 [Rhipicephalus appendiculatus]